jgi:PIN domain
MECACSGVALATVLIKRHTKLMTKPQQKQETVREFILFVDTNAIWTGDENVGRLDLVPAQFRQQWQQISAPGDVKLVIPDVVLFELAYQKQRQVLKAHKDARTNLERIESILPLGIPKIPEKSWGEIGHAVQASLRKQVKEIPHCQSVAIPYDAIAKNIRGIVDGSLWRLPPFKEGNNEAGFRDSLILETIRYFHAGLIHSDIALITKDGRLKEAIRREFSGAKNFGLYSDLAEYENFLNLARIRYQPEFLHSVASKAGDLFVPSIWMEARVAKQLIDRYDLTVGHFAFEQPKAPPLETLRAGLFALGTGGTARECAGDPLQYFGNTKLVSVVGDNEFHWMTRVLLITPYAPVQGLLSSSQNQNDVVFRVLLTSVEWKAVITDDQDFTNAELLRDQLILEVYEPTIELASSHEALLDLL